MKNILKTTLILVVLALTGCSEKKSRDFFAKGGITAGTAAALGSGSYKIPMEFETEIVHSGQWIDAVDATVAGSDILITASFISGNRKGSYPGMSKSMEFRRGLTLSSIETPMALFMPLVR